MYMGGKLKEQIMKLTLIDLIVISYCIFQILYVSLLGYNLDDPYYIISVYSGCLALTLISIFLRIRFKNRVCKFIGSLYPVVLTVFFYQVAGHQVHMFFDGVFDDYIIDLENWFFGVHPTIWVQKYYHPLLTEWMLLSYSVYLLLIPFTTIWLYATHRDNEWRHLLGSLLISFFICYVLYSLIPVVGPRVAMADMYSVELKGYIFRSFTKMLESDHMLKGGAFPSAHCSAATVMFILVFRYGKRLFVALAPVLITLILATIYGRYHYPLDVIAGIVIGIIGVVAFKYLEQLYDTKKRIELKKIAIETPDQISEITLPG